MTKRKRPSNGPAETDDEPKRPRGDNAHAAIKQSVSHGRVDPTSGQRSAIPGLDDDDYGGGESDLEYGTEMEDALSYLRSVRAEASTIPNLLVAPQSPRALYDNGIGDARGFYADGAYTAAPASPSPSADEAPVSNAQGKYYDALLARYITLRERLQRELPPGETVERLDRDHPQVFRGDAKEWKAWRWRLGNTDPWAAQLAGMERGCVLKLLRLVAGPGGCMKGRGDGMSGRTSRWIWGLLARLPEVGELGSEEVGVVRELGKKAVWVGVGLRGVDVGGLDGGDDGEEGEVLDMVVEDEERGTEAPVDDEEDDDAAAEPVDQVIGPMQPSDEISPQAAVAVPSVDGDAGDDLEALAAARSRMLERLQASAKDEAEEDGDIGDVNIEPEVQPEPVDDVEDEEGVLRNTRVTVDMIITIVGELYGQRDLLEYRDVWE